MYNTHCQIIINVHKVLFTVNPKSSCNKVSQRAL